MPVNGKCRKFDFPPTIRRYPLSPYCGAVFADGITSANVVGYQTKEILADDYTMFGIQFQGTDGEGVKFKDLSGNFYGGGSVNNADNILVWKDGVYTYYYYGVFGNASYPDWDYKWYNYDNRDADASEETIEAGTACWYLRRGDATTLTVSGQVKLTPTTTTILANDYTMFCNPYPTAIKFKNLSVAAPFGGGSVNNADNILVWKDGVYTYYYYGVFGNAAYPDWDYKWYNYDNRDADASEETIDPGVACWYLRRGEATTLSFTSPLAE